ncbi:transposase, partial [Falsirhodobacter xinxiangensis]|uniref:transposase n=1 Tax=Falsirhodobacter xinxiangensis TaxID=2530049 RepID=UPI001FE3C113
ADAGKMYSMSQELWQGGQIDKETAPRAVREYLETLDDAAFGGASEVRPKFVSCSDPASQWTAAMNAPAIFAYSTNYLIDTDHAVIVDVEASRSIRQAEVGAARTMIDRAKDRFDLQPERLAADTAYGSAEMLAWLDEREITQHIPVFDKTERADGTFPNTVFAFDPEANEYTCPGGNKLKKYWCDIGKARPAYGADGFRKYYASTKDCGGCDLKARCTPNQATRKISRHRHEAVRDKVRAFAGTSAYLESMRRRKKVEMLFAH